MGLRGTIAIGVTALLLSGGFSTAAPSAGLGGVETWGFAIGTGTLGGDLTRRYSGYDLLVVDGQEAKRRDVAELRSAGTVALGYLSVGTIETYRPWYRLLKPYRLGAWKDWKGEFFARVRSAGFRREVSGRIAPQMLAKGFDGLFLDNVDMIESHRRQARGMRKLVRRLSGLVRAEAGLLFAQNGFEIIGPLIPYLDGWNREDVTGSYDFDRDRYRVNGPRRTRAAIHELRSVGGRGLLVTATDYTRRRRGGTVNRAIANACAAGALPYVSDIGLRRTPADPARCR
jgi:polysaccharide biosynthesis protein PelA